jgi:hypothetical protein
MGCPVLTKGYGSSWIFGPYLTCANVLWRVQHSAFALVAARAGDLDERAGIGDRLGVHQMPMVAVAYLTVQFGAQPSIPAALGPRTDRT